VNAWCDGAFVPENALPARTGIAPFETMGAVAGGIPLWELHLARLQAAAVRLGLSWRPPAGLAAAAAELLRGNGHADAVLRLAVVPAGGRVCTVLRSRARSPVAVVRLLPTVVEPPADAPPWDLKAEPRAFYDAVRQQAQDGEADDGIVVGRDGAVLECATGNLWLCVDGAWATPALDGRVLPGIARGLLLARARTAGLRVVERVCDLADLHRATALGHSNAVHGLRPAALVGQPVGPAGVVRELGALWTGWPSA
jgi:branched-subunit amino acid aminotransferase/4-amino-4-deoxychorismate lyase